MVGIRQYGVCYFLFALFGLSFCMAEEPVNIPDPYLKALIEDVLWVYDPTPTDMLELIELNGSARNISDLTGLEYATNLNYLQLTHNNLTDVTPLSDLLALRQLILNNNHIVDVSPLSGLTELTRLDLHENGLSSLSCLSGLINLTYLNIHDNDIEDLSFIGGMNELRTLHMEENNVSDLSVFRGHSSLYALYGLMNNISDIEVLGTVESLRVLSLSYNPIVDIDSLGLLINLNRLKLSRTDVESLSPLCALYNLNYLSVSFINLESQAYEEDLQTICNHNPGMYLTYDPNPRSPGGLSASLDGTLGGVHLRWSEVANGPSYTSYYQVSRSSCDSSGQVVVSDWQIETTFVDDTIEMGEDYTYWVQCSVSSTGDQSGDYSSPVSVQVIPHLTIASSPGGTVNIPGEGSFTYDESTWISIVASPADPCLFTFSGWSGRAVEEGKVEDPHAMSTRVLVDGLYDLQANFVSTQSTLYVDAHAPASLEYGTLPHPFLVIQDAVEVSMVGGTIHVAPGTYEENVLVETEGLTLLGYDPNGTEPVTLPIIDGNGLDSCLTIDSNSVARGFVLTGGESAFSCRGHDVTLSHCLLVGNQSTDPNVGVIDITDSNTAMIHCTVSDNLGTSISLHTSTLSLYNSIVWGVDLESVSLDESSDLSLDHTASSFVWAGTSVFQADPLFSTMGLWQELDDGSWVWQPGDYHLQSVFGRWNPENAQWETDVQTSPYVGAGDRVIWQEKGWSSGGNPLNCGVYGGTPMASREEL